MTTPQGPQCTYPVTVRYRLRWPWKPFTSRRLCGKRASWRVMFWADLPRSREDPPTSTVYRCMGHRCHDVQARMLSQLTREIRL